MPPLPPPLLSPLLSPLAPPLLPPPRSLQVPEHLMPPLALPPQLYFYDEEPDYDSDDLEELPPEDYPPWWPDYHHYR